MQANLQTFIRVDLSGDEAQELVEELKKAIPHVQNCMSKMPLRQMSTLLEKLRCLGLESLP